MIENEIDGENSQADDSTVQNKIAVSDIGIPFKQAVTAITDKPALGIFRPDPHSVHQDICRVRSELSGFHPVEKALKAKSKIVVKDITRVIKINAYTDSGANKQKQ